MCHFHELNDPIDTPELIPRKNEAPADVPLNQNNKNMQIWNGG